MTHEERKNKILEITTKLQDLTIELGKLIAGCTHYMKNNNGIVTCDVCHRNFGWWCKKSPDNVCHYETLIHPVAQIRGIILADGNFFPMEFKEDYNPSTESLQSCLFCGEPLKRENEDNKSEESLGDD